MPFPIDLPQTPLLAAGLFLLLIIIGLLFRRETPYPYESAGALLTAGERAFAKVLYNAVGNDFRICHKVRLADVIVVRKGTSNKHQRTWFNRICGKHLDFVLCDRDTFEIIGIIELDDRSHRHASRQERDAFIDAALTAAGLPILHVPAQRSYSVGMLRGQIRDSLETGGAMTAERH
ncbi:MAG: DUF2726 domain-containing protein [Verrucomicrobiaceae bacterium]|nr:MAG: DUF2726 domain-containing protein [Verrucomicrobiaceae bacterium]